MENGKTQQKDLTNKPMRLKKILQYFVQGLIILAPITVTAYAIYWIFDKIDNILRPYINIPGIGFIIIIAFVIIIGYVSSFFLMERLISFFDQWLEKTPGVKFIYSSVRDFFEAFAGNKRKFNKAVLVKVFADEVWIIGFLTDEDVQNFNLGAEYVSVYVPQAYNFAGQLYMVKRERIQLIEELSSGEAMKYAVTGGVVDIDDSANESSAKKKPNAP